MCAERKHFRFATQKIERDHVKLAPIANVKMKCDRNSVTVLTTHTKASTCTHDAKA